MVRNSTARRPRVIDDDRSADVVVSLLHREALQMSVILRATARRLERRLDAQRVLRRRKLTLNVPGADDAP